MRYYSIDITNPRTGAPVVPSSLGGGKITSLLPTGGTNPAALNIEFDIPFLNFANANNDSRLRIWGLGLKDIGAALDLNGMNIIISAGMALGLPLANPRQQGILLKGAIYQAFGNWVGTDMTLDMNFVSSTGTSGAPLNFPFTWKAGTTLATAIGQTLAIAMPDFKQRIEIDPNLIIAYDETGYYQSAKQFNDYLSARSKAIIGGNYRGVTITTDGTTVRVFDGTQPQQGSVREIAFVDLIGQPTWIAPAEISVKMVLRGDLALGDTIKLPRGPQITLPQPGVTFQDRSSFTGNFSIIQIQHWGNFRQPDAAAWNTTIQATPVAN